MHETKTDMRGLQRLLDRSYSRAGGHLRSIWGEETRLPAPELCAELAGVQVLDLATVTAAGAPRVAPVDGLLHRGSLWFGSAPGSARFRSLWGNSAVSGSITRGLETFLVLVHGHAHVVDPRGRAAKGFAAYAREVYEFDWDALADESLYARIEPHTMLAFRR
jgi:hypothetical protein